MASNTKTPANGEKLVRYKLPRLSGANANQTQFVSFNFKNYLIERGKYVEIPESLAQALDDSELAEEAAIEYAENEKALKEPKA